MNLINFQWRVGATRYRLAAKGDFFIGENLVTMKDAWPSRRDAGPHPSLGQYHGAQTRRSGPGGAVWDRGRGLRRRRAGPGQRTARRGDPSASERESVGARPGGNRVRATGREAGGGDSGPPRCAHSSDAGLRAEADAAWARIGPGTRAALPYLADRTRSNTSQARAKAAATLGQEGIVALPVLLDTLAREHTPGSVHIGMVGGAPSLPPTTLGSSTGTSEIAANTRLRNLAIDAIGRLGAAAIPTLIEVMNESNASVREGTAQALGLMGPDAAPAVPVLIRALDDRDVLVRRWSIEALGAVGPRVASLAPALVAALDHKDTAVRRGAVTGASAVRPELRPDPPPL